MLLKPDWASKTQTDCLRQQSVVRLVAEVELFVCGGDNQKGIDLCCFQVP